MAPPSWWPCRSKSPPPVTSPFPAIWAIRGGWPDAARLAVQGDLRHEVRRTATYGTKYVVQRGRPELPRARSRGTWQS